jgi:hypothetical protein
MSLSPSGIAGLTGREPINAALTIGHKGPKGNPTDTDRLFIVNVQEENGVRPQHPSFREFNEADPELRKSLRGVLIHATQSECFEYHLKAQVLPGKPAHPNKRPACVGDGVSAVRWMGRGLDDFQPIPCPHDKCEFRQRVGDKPVPCKPWMRFLFRPRWKETSKLPAPMFKFTSGAWNTTAAFLGFFEHVTKQAKALGVENPTLYGLPFVLTLAKKKRRGDDGGRAFPIMSISIDGDLQEFLLIQHERFKQLASAPRPLALTDREQQDPRVVASDYASVNPGRGPVIDVDVPGQHDDDTEIP